MLKIKTDEASSKIVSAMKNFFLHMKKHEYTYKTDLELSKIYDITEHEMRLILGQQIRSGNISIIFKNHDVAGYVFRGCDVPSESLLRRRKEFDMTNKLAAAVEKEWIKY